MRLRMIDKTYYILIFDFFFTSCDFPWASIVHIFDNHSPLFRIHAHDDTDMTISEIVSWTIPDHNRARSRCLPCLKACSFCIFEPCACISSPFHWPVFCDEISTLTWDKTSSFWIDDFEFKFSSNSRTNNIWDDHWGLSTGKKQQLSDLDIIPYRIGNTYFF